MTTPEREARDDRGARSAQPAAPRKREQSTFTGFDRGERGIGVRDVVLVLPSVGCTNRVVELIGRECPGVRVVTHQHGCGQLGSDVALTADLLAGVCANPNVRGAVYVSLGCETNEPNALLARTRDRGAEVRLAGFQALGGTRATIGTVRVYVDELLSAPASRLQASLGDLTVGVLADVPCQPLLSALRDRLEAEGTRVLGGGLGNAHQVPGTAATVHDAWTPGARRRLRVADPLASASPVERMTAMTAAGAQLVVFMTGRADPIASPIAPTLKVGVEPALAGALEGVVDLDVEPDEPEASAVRIVDELIRAADGAPTAGELAGQRDFGIPRLSPTL